MGLLFDLPIAVAEPAIIFRDSAAAAQRMPNRASRAQAPRRISMGRMRLKNSSALNNKLRKQVAPKTASPRGHCIMSPTPSADEASSAP
jgi:hypothetical protein